MKHVRMRALCLAVAAMIIAAVVAATDASALPEWGKCEAASTHEGRYTDSNCTKKAKKVNEKFTGEFEWHNSTTFGAQNREEREFIEQPLNQAEYPLTLASAFIKCEPSEEPLAKCREGETEERSPVDVECEGENHAEGEFSQTSPKQVNQYVTQFRGCKALGLTCGNDREARLDTNALRGTLGYIKKATPKEVGIDWKPEFGKELARFTCGEAMTIVLGGASEKEGPFYAPKGGGDGVIAKVTPINELLGNGELFTQEFSFDTETDENLPNAFEGKSLQVLEDYFNNTTAAGKGSKWSPAGLSLSTKFARCATCVGQGLNLDTEIKA